MKLLSISIDIVNSTKLKTKINEKIKEKTLVQCKHEEIYNYLFTCEKYFYQEIIDLGLIENLFLIKSIGDELWYILDIEKIQKNILIKIVKNLISIACYYQNFNLHNKIKLSSLDIIKPSDVVYNDILLNKITIDII